MKNCKKTIITNDGLKLQNHENKTRLRHTGERSKGRGKMGG